MSQSPEYFIDVLDGLFTVLRNKHIGDYFILLRGDSGNDYLIETKLTYEGGRKLLDDGIIVMDINAIIAGIVVRLARECEDAQEACQLLATGLIVPSASDIHKGLKLIRTLREMGLD